MNSQTTDKFWRLYHSLPMDVRRRAQRVYNLWLEDPQHPSLRFKHVGQGIYSVRITLNYRALALIENGMATWFWIGNHDDYERLL